MPAPSLDRVVTRAHHSGDMASERLAKVLALASDLPPDERAELARQLARTLPPSTGDRSDFIDLGDEVTRRLDAIEQGTAEWTPIGRSPQGAADT
jgi:hypothetical protein